MPLPVLRLVPLRLIRNPSQVLGLVVEVSLFDDLWRKLVVNVKEAAAYLSDRGYRCSPGTVRALVKARKLACYRGPSPRGPMQFPPDELDRFLRDGLAFGDAKPAKPAERRPEKVAAARPVRSVPVEADIEAELAKVWGQ